MSSLLVSVRLHPQKHRTGVQVRAAGPLGQTRPSLTAVLCPHRGREAGSIPTLHASGKIEGVGSQTYLDLADILAFSQSECRANLTYTRACRH
jgi:hypothetical protein